MKRLSFVFVILLIGAFVAIGQQDPWWRPMNPMGTSAGVTYGSVAPSIATTGENPAPGEIWVDTNGAPDGGALIRIYNATAVAWQTTGTQIGVGETITFEGATADQFEAILYAEDPDTGDHTFHLPDQNAAADDYALMFSILQTNALQVASSIWFDTDQMIWEGTGVDAVEMIVTIENPTNATQTYRFNDNVTADIYPIMFSNYADNSWDTADSVWGTINGIHFEGGTVNDWELALSADDPLVRDQFFDLPNNDAGGAAQSYNLMFSLLDTNALDVANSVHGASNAIVWEGTTGADGLVTDEISLSVIDPTVNVTYTLQDKPITGTYALLDAGQAPAYNVELPVREGEVAVTGSPRFKTWFRTFATYTGGPPTTAGGVAACNTTAINYIFGPPIIGYGYELDPKGTQTVCGNDYVAADGMGLHTDATTNEGFELTQGVLTGAPGAFTIGPTAGGSPAFYFRIRFAIATVANTDMCYAGFRLQEAYNDTLFTTYTDYYVLGVGDLGDGGAGDWYRMSELNNAGAVIVDIAEGDWTDNEVHTIEIRVSAAGVVAPYIEGVLVGDAGAAYTFDDTDVVVPFFWCIADVTAADVDVDVVYWETGIQ